MIKLECAYIQTHGWYEKTQLHTHTHTHTDTQTSNANAQTTLSSSHMFEKIDQPAGATQNIKFYTDINLKQILLQLANNIEL